MSRAGESWEHFLKKVSDTGNVDDCQQEVAIWYVDALDIKLKQEQATIAQGESIDSAVK